MAAMAAMAARLRSCSLSAIANRADLLPKRGGVSIVERCPERFASGIRGFTGRTTTSVDRGCLSLVTGSAKTIIFDRDCLSLAAPVDRRPFSSDRKLMSDATGCQILGLAERRLGITIFSAGTFASGNRRLMVESFLKHGSPVARAFSSDAIDPRKHSVRAAFQKPVLYMSRRTFIEFPMPSPEAATSFISMLHYPIQWIKMYFTKENLDKWVETVQFGEKLHSAVGTFFMMLNKMKGQVVKGFSWIIVRKTPAVMGKDKKDPKMRKEFKVSMSFKYKQE